jgi:phosphocarrier protein
MFQRELLVTATVGLHARPAAQFSEIVKSAGFPIEVGRDSTKLVNAASPLRLLTLKIKQGESILVRCHTADENAADQTLKLLQACISE